MSWWAWLALGFAAGWLTVPLLALSVGRYMLRRRLAPRGIVIPVRPGESRIPMRRS